MAESLTISSAPPPLKSMDYALLREKAVQHIQELSGKIWTDDNAHDPGITILEMLAYAITDLGYRTNYNIRDILATASPEDIKNFFPAKEIMPNYPVTFKDYRKLLIDVEVPLGDPLCETVGVKNAWIEAAPVNEIPFYLDKIEKTLAYTKPTTDAVRELPRCLYNILLEFGECEKLGDLNANTLARKITLNGYTAPNDLAVNGTVVEFEVEFARWDTAGIDWTNPEAVKQTVKAFDLKFSKLPPQYSIDSYGVYTSGPNAGDLWITINHNFAPDVPLSQFVAAAINKEVFFSTGSPPVYSGMVLTYQEKIDAINRILAEVKATLMEHRNLGEDFYLYNAIKIDQIALCADVDITNNADVEEVYAQIMYQIDQFLDPTIYFYSLSEMYDKGYTTDQIFDGPLLKHGFIEDKELQRNDRRKTIHVSDLISIIMDIPGVQSVRKIQIAGIPLDNDDNIPVESVRWCLEVPIEKNYVPRLSVTDSKLLFFKDDLPYRANPDEAQKLLDELNINDRPQKLFNPSQDIPVEAGEYKDIENYFSIQEEFPLVYGTQSAGLPSTATTERKGQAKQLKGYLLFFEQILADYLSQLFHVKDLFSMNDGKDPDGNPIINKTYFSQSLINLVPDATSLYINPAGHAERLQAMVESEETFLERRNRFLSHLAQRFAESFVEYTLIEYKIDAPKAPYELIEDKLAFLNNYPQISSRRFNAFNYLEPCELWHIDNISGLERRTSYLAGVDKPTADLLAFSSNFVISQAVTPDEYYFSILDTLTPTVLLQSVGATTNGYPSINEAKLALELVVINGVRTENIRIYDGNNVYIPDPSTPPPGLITPYYYTVSCAGGVLGRSLDYTSLTDAATDATTLNGILVTEFYENPESNRYNLECFMDKYITTAPSDPEIEPSPEPGCPDIYSWNYTLRNADPDNPLNLLFGKLSKLYDPSLDPTIAQQAEANKEEMLMAMLRRASDIANYRFGVDNSMDEIFTVVDECGDVIGTSVEEDFNYATQQMLIQIRNATAPYNDIQVVDSDGNNGIYNITANPVMDVNNTRLLKVEVTPPVPSGIVGGSIRYDVSSTQGDPSFLPLILDANKAENFFSIDQDLHRILRPGQKVQVETGANAGGYEVVKIVQDGTGSLVYVKEDIVSTLGGSTLAYTLLLPIYKLDQSPVGNAFYVLPAQDEIAAKDLADWVKAKFFSHEGMHVVEHILLRPKYNEMGPALPITAGNNNELQAVTPRGSATYLKEFTLTDVDQPLKYFEFGPGDFTADFSPLKKIKIVGSTANDNTYTVRFATFTSGNTRVTVYENIPDGTTSGNIQYSRTAPILAVTPPAQIRINDPNFVTPSGGVVYITGSLDEVNDGKFISGLWTPAAGGDVLIDFGRRVAVVKDDFLPIDLDNGCGICRYEDPYSHIVSVILPAWQGRFFNQDFRRFFDKLIRLECPAHIVLNVCWIDCRQMGTFELHYKQWLQEQARPAINKLNVSNALNRVIEDITNLRSVYPEGVLHDCEADPDGDNAIILNQTILGNLTVT